MDLPSVHCLFVAGGEIERVTVRGTGKEQGSAIFAAMESNRPPWVLATFASCSSITSCTTQPVASRLCHLFSPLLSVFDFFRPTRASVCDDDVGVWPRSDRKRRHWQRSCDSLVSSRGKLISTNLGSEWTAWRVGKSHSSHQLYANACKLKEGLCSF